jgi:hypothetical protein
MEDLDRAIKMIEQTIASATNDSPLDISFQNIVGKCRSNRTGSMDNLNQAIKAFERTVSSIPNNHPLHGRRLNNLGNAL